MTLDLLVLGGTSWLGGAVARDALARGHRVTCLARGESGTPPDGVRWVRGDRSDAAAYDEVAGRPWDAVVDVGRQPGQVRSALTALAGSARHWVFVSTVSVYADDSTPDDDESAVVHEPFAGDEADPEDYGAAKVACELACRAALGEQRTTLVRAGLIVGHGDRSDRFGYWPARLARAAGGEPVLAPPGEAFCQVVDVADLAAWLVSLAERPVPGTFNAVGEPLRLADVLSTAADVAGAAPDLRPAPEQWLVDQDVAPWTGPRSLPLWLPQPAYAGFMTRRGDGARSAGLTLRPLAESVRDALAWERELGLHRDRQAGLTPDEERDLIERLPGGP